MDLTPYKNCIALTNGIFIANEEKPYRPCCWFREYVDAVDIEDYRNKISKMDLEKTCDYCIKQDQGGEYSYRKHFEHKHMLYITASFDNICNLKCVTCTPANSSLMIPDMFDDTSNPNHIINRKFYTLLGKQAPKKVDFLKDLITKIDFNVISEINLSILGGEPLINPFIYEFLDWLAEHKIADKTYVSITTNGTTYTDKIVKYIEKFKQLSVQLSIDGIEKDFEYLRSGANYEKLKEVCNSFYILTKSHDKFKMGIHYTLSWMNCLKFAEFINWVITNYLGLADIYISKLEQPDHFSIECLSLDIRTKIYNEVISKILEHNDPTIQNAIYLYKEHMLSTSFDALNVDKLNYGIGILRNVLDVKRETDCTELVNDFLEFTKIKNYHY